MALDNFAHHVPNFALSYMRKYDEEDALAEVDEHLRAQRHGVKTFLEQYRGKNLGAFEYLWQTHVLLAILTSESEGDEFNADPLMRTFCDESVFHQAIKAAKSVDLDVCLGFVDALCPGEEPFKSNKSIGPLKHLPAPIFRDLSKTLLTHGAHLTELNLGEFKSHCNDDLVNMLAQLPQLTYLGITEFEIILQHPKMLSQLVSLETHIPDPVWTVVDWTLGENPSLGKAMHLLDLIRTKAPQLQRLHFRAGDSTYLQDKIAMLKATAGIQNFTLSANFKENELQSWQVAAEQERPASRYETRMFQIDDED